MNYAFLALSASLTVTNLCIAQAVTITSGGWFDLRRIDQRSRVIAASANGSHLVVVMTGSPSSMAVVLNNNFEEVGRWPLPNTPQFLAVGPSSMMTWRQHEDGRHTACTYKLDGQSLGCTTGAGWAAGIVNSGTSFISITQESFSTVGGADGSRPLAARLSNVAHDGFLLFTSTNESILRLDGMSLSGSISNISSGEDRLLKFTSPALAEYQRTRRENESLVVSAIYNGKGQIWLTHARYNAYKGMPIDRFSLDGSFLGTFALKIPQFDELKRSSPGSLSGNPTGHLATTIVLFWGSRLVIIDPVALRCAWFDASELL